MAQHTPGPWLLFGDDGRSDATVYARMPVNRNPLYIARVYGEGVLASSSPGTEERKANARLIAAAPELLEALRDCVYLIKESGFRSGLTEETFDAALSGGIAAILAATGEDLP